MPVTQHASQWHCWSWKINNNKLASPLKLLLLTGHCIPSLFQSYIKAFLYTTSCWFWLGCHCSGLFRLGVYVCVYLFLKWAFGWNIAIPYKHTFFIEGRMVHLPLALYMIIIVRVPFLEGAWMCWCKWNNDNFGGLLLRISHSVLHDRAIWIALVKCTFFLELNNREIFIDTIIILTK